MNISERMLKIEHSPIRKFNKYALEAQERGIRIYRLNIGQPDIATPQCFMDAVKDFDDKVIAYSESGGEAVLQKAISKYFAGYGIDFKPDDIMVTNGGSEALSMIFTSILDPGDNVITAEPYYTNYNTFVTAAGGDIVPVTTRLKKAIKRIRLL